MELKQQQDPFFVEDKNEEAFLVYLCDTYQQFLSGEDSFNGPQKSLAEKFRTFQLVI